MFRDQSFLLGRITKTHGVHGEVICSFNNESPWDYEHLESVFLMIEGKLVPFFISGYRVRDDYSVIISFDNIDTEKKALTLKDVDVYADLDDKPAPEEVTDEIGLFVGYTLFDNEIPIGKITDILAFPNNYQFEIDYKGSKIMVPAADELVIDIDNENKKLVMDLPIGLIDLQLQ